MDLSLTDLSEREQMCLPKTTTRKPVKGSIRHVSVFLLALSTLNFSVTQVAYGDQREPSSIPITTLIEFATSEQVDARIDPAPDSSVSLEDALSLFLHLDKVGIPVGMPSKDVGAEQLRGLCIAREFSGLKIHRGKLRPSEMTDLLQLSQPISAPKRAVEGLNVSLSCQVAWYVQDGKVLRVMRATTGAQPGWTPTGTFKVTWRTKGWTYSTIYKDAKLYKIHHFKGAVGFHGVASPSWIKTKPASHGCVRLPNKDMDWLEARMPPGSLVRVYGTW